MSERTVFIHTNNKQKLGAELAKYAILHNHKSPGDVTVEFLNVDEMPEFKAFAGTPYLRKGREIKYDPNDLQSFTLSRFMPPQKMNYQGYSVVIDPDIFAIGDIAELFAFPMNGKAVAACKKKDAWDTSVMLMDNAKLTHWKIADILDSLRNKKLDYNQIMTLETEPSVTELPRIWNSLDHLDQNTKMLHTTNRETQPWRTGLPIDFTRNPLPKYLGIIPREPIMKMMGKISDTYLPHPDKNIERFFFTLVRDAIRDGAFSEDLVRDEIRKGHVRRDALEVIAALPA